MSTSEERYIEALAEQRAGEVPDAMDLCNSCDIERANPLDPAGYCDDCHDRAGERLDEVRASW